MASYYEPAMHSKYAHGPRFTDQQRNLIVQRYDEMKTLPEILQEFREAFPRRAVSVTENSIRSCLDRAPKADLIKRQKYSRSVAVEVKLCCIELYNTGMGQRAIIKGVLERFPDFGREINRNMISGWVKWGKENKLLKRVVPPKMDKRSAGYVRTKPYHKEHWKETAEYRHVVITLPYVRCLDPKRAQEMAKVLGMPIEVYLHRQRWRA